MIQPRPGPYGLSQATELRHALGLRHSGVHITFDLLLDLIADPATRTWRWKDEGEYAQIRRAGFVGDAESQRVRAARHRAVAFVEAGRGPFAEDWTSFRVPRDWHCRSCRPRPLDPGQR